MGYTMQYLSLLVLIPLGGLFFTSASLSWSDLRELVTNPGLVSALKLTFGAALLAAVINALFGFIIAWTLVRFIPSPATNSSTPSSISPFALPTHARQRHHPRHPLRQHRLDGQLARGPSASRSPTPASASSSP